jgi:ankyrin repeat protein
MEDICLRIPHILEQINESLDDKSLIKCKEGSRMMCSIVENQKSGKFLTIRAIQSYINNSKEFARDWRIVFQKLPLDSLKKICVLVKDFYKSEPLRMEGNWSPLHISAEQGHLEFCEFIEKFSTIKSYDWPPLYLSVQAGHLEVSKFLYKEFKNKKSRRILEIVQHLAAKNGHLKIYKFLHENTNYINPFMQEGITPLHLAAQYGQWDICNYICDNTAFVGPHRSDWNTPLTLAIQRGRIKIARLLYSRDDNFFGMETILKVLKAFCVFLFIFAVYDIFVLYPKSLLCSRATTEIHGNFIENKCHLENRAVPGFPLFPYPMRYIRFIIICLSGPFAIAGALILFYIRNDILFRLWTSPKLDY